GNLAEMYGVDVAERFLRACRAVVGSSFVHHPCWDLLVLIETLPGPPSVYPPWIDFGIRDLTDEIVQGRVDEYLASVMARL
ncbi:MAG: aminoglycoside phosphotransferase family protein, partial [Anaerolineae bacterium]|nr:aminoglycoside phosphotransferase family protein [Anaerolineae bacterium]